MSRMIMASLLCVQSIKEKSRKTPRPSKKYTDSRNSIRINYFWTLDRYRDYRVTNFSTHLKLWYFKISYISKDTRHDCFDSERWIFITNITSQTCLTHQLGHALFKDKITATHVKHLPHLSSSRALREKIILLICLRWFSPALSAKNIGLDQLFRYS